MRLESLQLRLIEELQSPSGSPYFPHARTPDAGDELGWIYCDCRVGDHIGLESQLLELTEELQGPHWHTGTP